MKINKEIIQKLNPCRDRFNNFTTNYPDFDSNLEDFILLDKISYDDKVWVFTKLATKEQNVKWALLCASKVLSIFEDKYPNDKRPRQALEAVEAWLKNPTCDTADAAYAARAADAAAYSANGATYAAYAAASAADAARAADAAAYAADFATADFATAAYATAAYAARAAYVAADAARAADAAAYAADFATAAYANTAAYAARAIYTAAARNIEEEVNLMFMVEAIKCT